MEVFNSIEDKRSTDVMILDMITTVLQEQRKLSSALTQHIQDESINFDKMILAALALGYPGGDAEEHRRGHELTIKVLLKRVEFWDKMKISVSSWGLIGVLGALALWAWTGFLKGPHP